MKRLRTLHGVAAILVGIAIALLIAGHLRLPIAILCFVCLVFVASGEALRVSASTSAWKHKQ